MHALRGRKEPRQKHTSIVFMMSFYCLKTSKEEGVSGDYQTWSYILFMDGPKSTWNS